MKKSILAIVSVAGMVGASYAWWMCIEVYQPVCAVKDGLVKTFSNSCFAKVAWAQVLHEGVCTGDEKVSAIKNFKYIKWQTKEIVDKTIERYFDRLSSKSLPEQLNILQEKTKKINQVREQLQKAGKLSDLIAEVLYYLEFKFEEKVNELKSKLTGGQNDISQDLLQSILQETR